MAPQPQLTPLSVERWFGAVTTRPQPEDFKEACEEFEVAVAAEVAGAPPGVAGKVLWYNTLYDDAAE